MGRSLDDVLASLPDDRRARVEARARELIDEVESLRELRRISGKAQNDIASFLGMKQPSVSKIEKQTDMYLSTLRNYIDAIGGELELIVRLPSRPPLRLGGAAMGEKVPGPKKVAAKPRKKTRAG
jgi:hypothetical protein